MSLVRVHNFSVSLDGFSAGAGQSLEAPFGHAGDRLVRWFMGTRSFHAMHGPARRERRIDDAFASNWGPGIGAEIMGRNKFGPQRGPWTDEEWKGWWGEEPPFHTPVFVLTHHVRPSIEMKGGTTFHFIDASPAAGARGGQGGRGRPRRPHRRRPGHRPPVPRRRPDRPPAHRDRADPPRPRRVPLGRPGGPGGALRHRVGELAQRRHPRHVHPSLGVSDVLVGPDWQAGPGR